MSSTTQLVLVTGATGFTGWHATKQLLAEGHRVRALVRSLEKARTHLGPLGLGDADFVVGDMTDRDAVKGAVTGCDSVIHAAAAVSVTKAGAADAFDGNADGARCVLGIAHDHALDPIVFVSSLTAILDSKRPEATRGNSPLVESATRYGRSKAESDQLARDLESAGAPVCIVYPSAIIGPGDPGRSESMSAYRGFLQFMIDSEGGTQFVDGRDLGQLFARIVTTKQHGRIIAAGTHFTWRELRLAIGEATGAEIGAIRAPGFVLRTAGRIVDLASQLTGRSFMISREAMEVATRWRPVADSPAVSGLGVEWRPASDTLRDVYGWFLERGAIPAKQVPKLAPPA